MCGRFTQRYSWRDVHDFLDLLGPARNLEPRHNIAPTADIDVLLREDARLRLATMRWGLIPSWWKKTRKEVPATFNARAETVATKPMFRAAFKRSRCIVPASGFYEWETTTAGKQPWYITAADGSVLLIAGLWERWTDVETGEDTPSATMVVSTANAFMSEIHDRMPVLFDRGQIDAWIDGQVGAEVLTPAPEGFLKRWRVSPKVNSSRTANTADLIAPL